MTDNYDYDHLVRRLPEVDLLAVAATDSDIPAIVLHDRMRERTYRLTVNGHLMRHLANHFAAYGVRADPGLGPFAMQVDEDGTDMRIVDPDTGEIVCREVDPD